MSDVKVILAYIAAIILWALVPFMMLHTVASAVVGGGLVVIWWIIAALYGDKILLWSIRAEPLNISKYNEIVEQVMSRRPGPSVGTPSFWMLPDLAPMTMSLGLGPQKYHMIFTRGALDRIDDKALIGLIVRELQAMRSGLTSANTGAATLLWFILLPGRIVGQLLGLNSGEPHIIRTIANIFSAPIGGLFGRLFFNQKRRIYSIDNSAFVTLEKPEYLPYALKEMSEKLQATPFNCELALSTCCIINQNSRDPWANLYKLLPSTPKRIKRLLLRKKNG